VSLEATARGGDRLATLRALRDRLAKEIDETRSARDVAALSRQLTEVLAEIEALAPPVKEVDPLAALVVRPSVGSG
jgi:hypothetical protein